MRKKNYKHISTVVVTRKELKHSAKGSTWKDHKYIKKVGDKYIYADDQQGGGNSDKLGDLLTKVTNGDMSFADFEKQLSASGVSSDKLKESLIAVANERGLKWNSVVNGEIVPNSASLEDVFESYGSWQEAMETGEFDDADVLKEAMKRAMGDQTKDSKTEESKPSEEFDIEQMAQKVIRGEFGNGADRKELLGESYKEIQNRVNEILLGEKYVKKQSSKKTSTAKKENTN